VQYAPAANFAGADSFTYTVSDGRGGIEVAVVSITVVEVNDPPTANDDVLSVEVDSGSTVVDVLANDSTAPDDPALETLSVQSASGAAHGTTRVVAGGVEYTPAPGFVGADSFSVVVSDGRGGTRTSTVAVTVRQHADSDADGLFDIVEDKNGNGVVDPGETDPHDADSDDDGLLDGVEDANHDGVREANETDPLDADTDDDGLKDGVEDANHDGVRDADETDPLDADSDNDDLDDGVEDANKNGVVDADETDPLNPDTDGGGATDGSEVAAGTDPLNPTDDATIPR
jgi:hypothetical protein